MQDTRIKIELSSQGASTTGQVLLRPVSKNLAFRKGLVGLFSTWAMAFVTLPIPLVHFIAPPVLLILGPFVGYLVHKLYKNAVDIVEGGATCPVCGATVSLANRDAHWPLYVICFGCQTRLEARRTS